MKVTLKLPQLNRGVFFSDSNASLLGKTSQVSRLIAFIV